MFVITRNINGAKEVLKSSNSQSYKFFLDIGTAMKFAKLLNQNTIPSMQWSVSKVNNK